jgi:hypothetical protein
MIPIMVKVFRLSSGFWRVEPSLDERSLLFPSEAQAMSFALAWAESHQPCEVRVFGPIGEPERSMTFPNGNYRRPAGPDRRRTQVDIPFPDRRNQKLQAQV